MSSLIPISQTAIDFVVKERNGLTGLVDSGLETLPRQYIQPVEERFDTSNQVAPEESIPIIDVSDWDDPEIAESMCEAASKWGFFQIINHGVPLEVLENVKEAGHGFFGLPDEERRKYWKGHSPSDTVFLATSFSPHTERVLEWKDYLSFLYISGDESSSFWPPVCRDQVLDYMKRAELVIKRLLDVLLRKLNVNEIDKAKEYALMGSLRVNINFYPHCPNPELTAGVGRHSDISSITILLQDEVGGLYVREINGDCWIHVPPVPGALVINVGDVLQIMSNGHYKSVEHRVVANRSKSRVSIPIFVNPAPDAAIGPLPEVLKSGETPIYKQVIYSDYFQYFFSKGHDGKKTIDFAKI